MAKQLEQLVKQRSHVHDDRIGELLVHLVEDDLGLCSGHLELLEHHAYRDTGTRAQPNAAQDVNYLGAEFLSSY